MEAIEFCRRSGSKKLLQFLGEMGYPNSNAWIDFNPNLGDAMDQLSDKLLTHFKQQLPYIERQVTQSTVISKKNPKIPSKFGKFIDYTLKLAKDPEFQKSNPSIAKQLSLAEIKQDSHRIQTILNKHYRSLIPYWERCHENRDTQCDYPLHLKDIYNFFASPDIQEEIEKDLVKSNHISGQLYNKNFNFGVFYNPQTGLRKGRKQGLLIRLGLMMSLINSSQPTNSVDVNVWLASRPTLMYDLDDKYLGIMNVNSGCTIRDMSSYPIGRVIIWREEECDKVLVHELIHALELDFFQYAKNIDKEIFNHFDIVTKNNINIFETYTETWAVIISTTIYSLLCGKGTSKEIKELLILETAYSFAQIAKILVLYDYKCFSNCELFCPKGFSQKTRKNKFKQGSSILAYYIFKTG